MTEFFIVFGYVILSLVIIVVVGFVLGIILLIRHYNTNPELLKELAKKHQDLNSPDWLCESCNSFRKFDEVGVISYTITKGDLQGLGVQRNLKFCKDKQECRALAVEKANSGNM